MCLSPCRRSPIPLVRGFTSSSISRNIRTLFRDYRRTGKIGRASPRSLASARIQAVAIALELARDAWRSRHPKGPYPAHISRRSNPAWGREVRRAYPSSSKPPVLGKLQAARNPSLVCPACGNTISETADPGAYNCACGTEVAVSAKT